MTPLQSNLARLLSLRTVAVVGASEKLGMSNNAVLAMLEAGHTVLLVNPTQETLYGQPCYPSLTAALAALRTLAEMPTGTGQDFFHEGENFSAQKERQTIDADLCLINAELRDCGAKRDP